MRTPRRRILVGIPLLAISLLSAWPGRATAQARAPVGREAVESLRFQRLSFEPAQVQKRALESGIPVFVMEDHSLPLVTLYARFRGGYALLPRNSYAPAFALSGLLRSGGTTVLPPDSVDHLMDHYALQMTFGGGGSSTYSSVNTLTKHLAPATQLWGDILRNPRFDSLEVEIWRDRQLEGTRRRADNPNLLAFSEFNQIMFGDHPIGWEFTEADLTREKLNSATMSDTYSRVLCPENLVLGVVGDVEWDEVAPLLEEMFSEWPSCAEPLLEPRTPELREGRSVFLIPKDVTQSTIVIAGPGGVSQGAGQDYFASRIGNSILGSGGFSSRLLSRVRTDMGYAYSASSFWTTPSRYEGIVGATTQTKSESTVAVTQLMLEIIGEMSEAPPDDAEVERTISQIVNSFVFNFQDPSQAVSRQMFYLASDLPEDWLERYVEGIQRVDAGDVQEVFRTHVVPEDMIILIVGNPDDFDAPPETLGPVQIWDVDGGGGLSVSPRGGRRFPR